MSKLKERIQEVGHSKCFPKLNDLMEEDCIEMMSMYGLSVDEFLRDDYNFIHNDGNFPLASNLLCSFAHHSDFDEEGCDINWVMIFRWFIDGSDIFDCDQLFDIANDFDIDLSDTLYPDNTMAESVTAMSSDKLFMFMVYMYEKHYDILEDLFTMFTEKDIDSWVSNRVGVMKSKDKIKTLGLTDLDVTVAFMDLFDNDNIKVSIGGEATYDDDGGVINNASIELLFGDNNLFEGMTLNIIP